MNSKALFRISLIRGNYGILYVWNILDFSSKALRLAVTWTVIIVHRKKFNFVVGVRRKICVFIFTFYRTFVGNSWIFQHNIFLVINFSIDFTLSKWVCKTFSYALLAFKIDRFILCRFMFAICQQSAVVLKKKIDF
jgi:hypothetical protein